MTTKSRRHEPAASSEITATETTAPTTPVGSFRDLAMLREQAAKRRSDTAEIIASLIQWRSEIDATIAYLRAQEK